MKKILSFVLVLAMIASMMCIGVSAEGASNGAEDIVGTHKGKGVDGASINDGVATFDPTSNGGSVMATLSAIVNNRYAVELEYSVSNITISGDATWNVNTLVYDNNLKYKINDGAEAALNAAVKEVEVANFSVTNFSDLGVTVSLEADISTITAAGANIECKFQIATGEARTTTVSDPVAGAYNADSASGVEGTAKTGTYTAYLACTDWARAFTDLKNANPNAATQAINVAAITISVAPQNTNHLKTQPQG